MQKAFLAALAFIGVFAIGCKSDAPVRPVQPTAVQGSAVQSRSFQDEQYIWESWTYGTNKVEKSK